VHPGGGGRDQAILAVAQIIANPDPQTDDERVWVEAPDAACETIRQAHTRWMEGLKRGVGNQFQQRMTLSRWIHDGDWQRQAFEDINAECERIGREYFAKRSRKLG
jgi:hypothetical protein